MSGMFFNKLAGAALAAGLGFIMINKFSGVVMHADVPKAENFAYSLAVEATTAIVEVLEIPFPSPTWLGARDAERGAKVFKKCRSCHTSSAEIKHGTGPAMWNIVGQKKAHYAEFKYSDAMRNKAGVWGYAELDAFLTKPKDYIPKTKMAFNGLKKEADRAAVIEYLRLAADVPMAQLVAVETPPTQEVVQEVIQESVEEAAPTTDGEQ